MFLEFSNFDKLILIGFSQFLMASMEEWILGGPYSQGPLMSVAFTFTINSVLTHMECSLSQLSLVTCSLCPEASYISCQSWVCCMERFWLAARWEPSIYHLANSQLLMTIFHLCVLFLCTSTVCPLISVILHQEVNNYLILDYKHPVYWKHHHAS